MIDDFCAGLEQRNYPYDIAYVRWSGNGDNAVPEPQICDFIRDWNAKYSWPRFVVASTSEAFRAFEAKHGAKTPVVKGDWTPYWEDGAGSSALETGTNRHSSDRLVQAETLYAMLKPEAFPAADFENAWNSVLLYSEHTWGAWCSTSGPERKETLEQWAIKQSYALDADKQSRALLNRSLDARPESSRDSATQLHLMDEIRKVQRVIRKTDPGAPHETLLVLDANTGQNALAQVRAFDDALGLTGLILAKLDGSAKGGMVAAIAKERPIQLRFIGVGVGLDDLKPFVASDLVEALVG